MDGKRIQEDIQRLKTSATKLSGSSEAVRNALLLAIGEGLSRSWPLIKAANQKDVQEAKETGLPDALIKRLVFDQEKLASVQLGLAQVAQIGRAHV